MDGRKKVERPGMELDQPSLGRQSKGTSLLGLLGIAGPRADEA